MTTTHPAWLAWLAWLAVIAATVLAAPVARANPEARRKGTPAKVTRAASEAFTDAAEADKKGDLLSALGLYQKAFEIAPHPATSYNAADVLRRLGRIDDAIKSYETYLALSPTASDRKEVEAVIEQLARTPGTLLVTTFPTSDPRAIDLKRSYILANGELLVRPGTEPTMMPGANQPAIALEVRGGTYVIDIVTSIGYGVRECAVRPGARAPCIVHAPPRTDGAVVISGNETFVRVVTEPRDKAAGRPRATTRVRERFEHPAGRTKLMVRDRSYECPALVLDVPRGADVGYTFIETTGYDRLERCRPHAIKQHRLRFEP